MLLVGCSTAPLRQTHAFPATWPGSQPLSEENATYIFKDHGGDAAADLIEQAGLKGTRIGNVEISDQNANFFVAHSGATSADVLRLIDLVKTQVADRLEIELETAIQVW